MSGEGRAIRPTLSRQWLLKIGAFLLLLLGFGVWGTVDAVWLYPQRGLADASFQLHNWLTALDQSGRLTTSNATIADPRAALMELKSRQDDLFKGSTAGSLTSSVAKADLAKLTYLESLSKVWRLNADDKPVGRTSKPTPRNLYFEPDKGAGYAIEQDGKMVTLSTSDLTKELAAYWKVTQPATPLSGFDMLFQYIFIVVGYGGAAFIVGSILRARARCQQIGWEPSSMRLTLGAGAVISPENFADLDKRLWHKYYADVLTTDGRAHRVDLLRYVPLEDWVLDLERNKFPERAAEEAAKKAAAEAAQQAQARGDVAPSGAESGSAEEQRESR